VSLQAVIFDCDGVLVDSEPLAWMAWRELLAGYAYEPSEDDIRQLLGRTADEILAHFTDLLGPTSEVVTTARLNTIMGGLFERHLVPFGDGAALAAAATARGLRLAVASSSGRERVLRALELTHLRHFFDVIVTADDVPNGKPAPDVYLEAARRLGVPRHRCLAIEDSEHGVTSALAAGMPVVAVVRPYTPRDGVSRASVVVDDLSVSLLDHQFSTHDSSNRRSAEGAGPTSASVPRCSDEVAP
jgi:beta-phosphoglucomutase-like phosphatase (HAD superfamily)